MLLLPVAIDTTFTVLLAVQVLLLSLLHPTVALCLDHKPAFCSNMSIRRLPVMFLSHGGGPAHLLDFTGSAFAPIDRNSKSADFMRSLSQVVNEHASEENPVQCILVVSGHWEEPNFTVDYQIKSTKLVYDYYGFPEESYAPQLTYPVKTNLKVANKVVSLLQKANIPVEKADRGFDHGVFIPLKVAYPDANIPVVQLSLKSNLNVADHIRLGEVLQPLRDQGVLIIGSGQKKGREEEVKVFFYTF